MEGKTLEVKFNEVEGIAQQTTKNDNDFVNREFMRYYSVKQHITDETYLPANPKNFYDQIQFAVISGTSYLYLNINNTWKKVTLT